MPVDQIPQALTIAYDALNLMGGNVDGALLPFIVEIFGMTDIETMLRLMRIIIIEERKNSK